MGSLIGCMVWVGTTGCGWALEDVHEVMEARELAWVDGVVGSNGNTCSTKLT